jgi:hypothetical protein
MRSIVINNFRNNKREMTVNEIVGVGGLFFTLIGAIIRVWFMHDTRITKLESKSYVCDEKHRQAEKIQLKQAEINTKVDENHSETMKVLGAIEAQISILIKTLK